METSAKDSTNVKLAFERVLNEIYKIISKNVIEEPKSIVTALSKGKELNDDIEVFTKPKGVHLKKKNRKKEADKRCC